MQNDFSVCSNGRRLLVCGGFTTQNTSVLSSLLQRWFRTWKGSTNRFIILCVCTCFLFRVPGFESSVLCNTQCTLEHWKNGERVILSPKLEVLLFTFRLCLAANCGDCVVVINTKHVAMRDEMWRTWKYFNHTGFVLFRASELVLFYSESLPVSLFTEHANFRAGTLAGFQPPERGNTTKWISQQWVFNSFRERERERKKRKMKKLRFFKCSCMCIVLLMLIF